MRRWISVVLVAALVSASVGIGAFIAAPRVSMWLGLQVQTSVVPSAPKAATKDKSVAPTVTASSIDPWWVSLSGKVAWPAALLLALAMIAWNSRLRRIFGTGTRLVRKVSAGGVEMEINADAVDEIRDKLRESFRELVGSARDEFERMADLQDLDRYLEAVVESVLIPKLVDRPAGMRATIHVRDIVFRDYLYQLVGYYPMGGGAHRRFSQRYGIIGRSWRSGRSHGTGNAFGVGASTETLVENWGMTRDETHGVLHTRPSCLSVLLRLDSVPIGILYVDSTGRDAFGDDGAAQKLATSLEVEPLVKKLAASVGRTLAPLRVGGPNLDLKELGR